MTTTTTRHNQADLDYIQQLEDEVARLRAAIRNCMAALERSL